MNKFGRSPATSLNRGSIVFMQFVSLCSSFWYLVANTQFLVALATSESQLVVKRNLLDKKTLRFRVYC